MFGEPTLNIRRKSLRCPSRKAAMAERSERLGLKPRFKHCEGHVVPADRLGWVGGWSGDSRRSVVIVGPVRRRHIQGTDVPHQAAGWWTENRVDRGGGCLRRGDPHRANAAREPGTRGSQPGRSRPGLPLTADPRLRSPSRLAPFSTRVPASGGRRHVAGAL